jgi:NAD+ diphosphatase
MIGFFATYAGGELQLDPSEIVDGGWFRPDDLPALPPYPSIARRLIDEWLERSGVSPT